METVFPMKITVCKIQENPNWHKVLISVTKIVFSVRSDTDHRISKVNPECTDFWKSVKNPQDGRDSFKSVKRSLWNTPPRALSDPPNKKKITENKPARETKN